jgi:hypothetical protein
MTAMSCAPHWYLYSRKNRIEVVIAPRQTQLCAISFEQFFLIGPSNKMGQVGTVTYLRLPLSAQVRCACQFVGHIRRSRLSSGAAAPANAPLRFLECRLPQARSAHFRRARKYQNLSFVDCNWRSEPKSIPILCIVGHLPRLCCLIDYSY